MDETLNQAGKYRNTEVKNTELYRNDLIILSLCLTFGLVEEFSTTILEKKRDTTITHLKCNARHVSVVYGMYSPTH